MTNNPHKWERSRLGHGNMFCPVCCMTDLEAIVLGRYMECEPIKPSRKVEEAKDEHL